MCAPSNERSSPDPRDNARPTTVHLGKRAMIAWDGPERYTGPASGAVGEKMTNPTAPRGPANACGCALAPVDCMDIEHEDVVVTALIPYGESDCVVRLFGREKGRFSAFAKGAKRSKNRFAGTLQPLAQGVATLRPRRGTALYVLEELEADPHLWGLAADAHALGRASYLAELVERLLPEGVPEPGIFARLRLSLALFAAQKGSPALLRAFELKFLADTGHLPDLDSASDDPEASPCALNRMTGELVAHPSPGCTPFPEDTRRLASMLLQSPLDQLPSCSSEELKPVGRLFALHLRRQGLTELKSIAFLRALDS